MRRVGIINIMLVSVLAATLVGCPPPATAPVASFTADPATGNAPLTVQFTDTSSPGTAAITSWAWDFGDGETGDEEDALHTFALPGSYTVTLTVTSDDGTDAESVVIVVSGAGPNA
ncbi:MAG: large repetitive protein, partial [Candidatus Hydrogenedentes bacterium]|nr:large repetitive protein [Candidatus Hydrogenedentota bacterium]